MVKKATIIAYCIANQYQLQHTRIKTCYLCQVAQYMNITIYLIKKIFLHQSCFDKCYHIRKFAYINLYRSIIKNIPIVYH